MKSKIIFCLALVLGGGLFGCKTAQPNAQIIYHNAKYDFTFSLPASWQGYSVLIQQWEGETYSSTLDKTVVTGHGPIIILRHPQWKEIEPYQDIPILVFTRSQWNSLNHGNLWPSLYAGGAIDEIGHSQKYVFVISSRYNWGELNSSKEVAEIVNRYQEANAPTLYPKP